jgi:DNA-binding NarL/FixJ family response regulator
MSSKSQPSLRSSLKRVFLVDDHPVFRSGLAELIRHEKDLQICGEASDAEQAIKDLARARADLTIIDLSLRGKSGLELIRDLRIQFPQLFILVLSMHAEHLYAERALRAGANGYVMKQEIPEVIIKAIRKVFLGEVYLSNSLSCTILHTFAGHQSGKPVSPVVQLSDREFEVFRMVGEGKPTKQIAYELSISSKTVDAHRAHIRDKLQLQNGPDLICYAARWLEANKAPYL